MERQQPETPELNRLKAIELEWSHIRYFLEWLLDEKKVCLARWSKYQFIRGGESVDSYLTMIPEGRFDLLNEYFNLDPAKLEAERRLLLDWVREMQKH